MRPAELLWQVLDRVADLDEHGEGGVAVHEVRAEEGLAAALREILQNSALQAELSRKARERAEAEYAIERQAQRYAALYEDVIERARGAQRGSRLEPTMFLP